MDMITQFLTGSGHPIPFPMASRMPNSQVKINYRSQSALHHLGQSLNHQNPSLGSTDTIWKLVCAGSECLKSLSRFQLNGTRAAIDNAHYLWPYITHITSFPLLIK